MENSSQSVDTTAAYGGNTHIGMDENNQPHFDQPVRLNGVEVRQPKCEILENVVLVNGFRPFPIGFSEKHTTNKDTTSKRPFYLFKSLQKSKHGIQFKCLEFRFSSFIDFQSLDIRIFFQSFKTFFLISAERRTFTPRNPVDRINSTRQTDPINKIDCNRERTRNPIIHGNNFQKVSQTDFDNSLINLIVDRLLPISFVESEAFKTYSNCK